MALSTSQNLHIKHVVDPPQLGHYSSLKENLRTMSIPMTRPSPPTKIHLKSNGIPTQITPPYLEKTTKIYKVPNTYSTYTNTKLRPIHYHICKIIYLFFIKKNNERSIQPTTSIFRTHTRQRINQQYKWNPHPLKHQ